MVAWRVYYADGATFDSSQGAPEDSPREGVAAIVQHYDCAHHPSAIIKPEAAVYVGAALSANFYVWRPDAGEWIGTLDIFGVVKQAERRAVLLRQGEMMPHEAWERVWLRASSDPDFTH